MADKNLDPIVVEEPEAPVAPVEDLELKALKEEMQKVIDENKAMKEEVARIKASNLKLSMQVNNAKESLDSFEDIISNLYLNRKR